MKKLIEKSKNLFLIAVASSLAASAVAFLWGMVKTILVIIDLVLSLGKDPLVAIDLIKLMDIFLIATILFIFAMGMYELFIGNISLPEWLIITNLHDLKVKLGSVIILVMGYYIPGTSCRMERPAGDIVFWYCSSNSFSIFNSVRLFRRKRLIAVRNLVATGEGREYFEKVSANQYNIGQVINLSLRGR